MNDIIFRNPELLTSSCTPVRRRIMGFVTKNFVNFIKNLFVGTCLVYQKTNCAGNFMFMPAILFRNHAIVAIFLHKKSRN